MEWKSKKYQYYEYRPKVKKLWSTGISGSKPWGNLTAINLNNGKIIWQVPFGEYEELKKIFQLLDKLIWGATKLQEILFLLQEHWIKKYIWFTKWKRGLGYELPFIGSSPPTVYEYNGEQYIQYSHRKHFLLVNIKILLN